MKMFEAMRKCESGGYVARKAYPNRKYHKDENGIYPKAANVDYIDFLAMDWEYYPADNQDLPLYTFKCHREARNQNRLCLEDKMQWRYYEKTPSRQLTVKRRAT